MRRELLPCLLWSLASVSQSERMGKKNPNPHHASLTHLQGVVGVLEKRERERERKYVCHVSFIIPGMEVKITICNTSFPRNVDDVLYFYSWRRMGGGPFLRQMMLLLSSPPSIRRWRRRLLPLDLFLVAWSRSWPPALPVWVMMERCRF